MIVARPAVVAFDVVETMFSLAPVREALGSLGVDLDLLFARLLRDGFALTAAGGHRPFAEVARSGLSSLAPQASESQREQVMGAFAQLPAYPDVEPALRQLHRHGVTVAALTNGGAGMTTKLLESASARTQRDWPASAGFVGWVPARDSGGR